MDRSWPSVFAAIAPAARESKTLFLRSLTFTILISSQPCRTFCVDFARLLRSPQHSPAVDVRNRYELSSAWLIWGKLLQWRSVRLFHQGPWAGSGHCTGLTSPYGLMLFMSSACPQERSSRNSARVLTFQTSRWANIWSPFLYSAVNQASRKLPGSVNFVLNR